MTRRSRIVERTTLAALAALLLAVAAPAQDALDDGRLTIEDIYGSPGRFSRPLPSNFLWLPDGSAFLYFHRQEGTNRLWRFDIAGGEQTMLADWDAALDSLGLQEPEGEEMSDVNFAGRGSRAPTSISPDGGALLVTHRGEIFTYDLDDGNFRRLTQTPAEELWATYSPDGRKVAFVRDGDLYWIDLATGEEHRLTEREGGQILNGVPDWVYDEELGLRRAFWWAPNSERIAYMRFDVSPVHIFPIVDHLPDRAALERQRYPKAGDPNPTVRLGVVPLDGSETVWIGTGDRADFYIVRAEWLPGGERLSFQILNRDQTRLELCFADPTDGASRVALVEEDPTWVNVRDDLRFLDGGGFIWSSEADGWRHLYLYDYNGNLLRQLTVGEWQVEAVYGLDAAEQMVYFQATERSLLERHLYRVRLDGGGLERLTEAEGTHYADLAPGGGCYLDRYSSPTTPTRLDLYDADGEAIATLDDGRIEALEGYRLTPPEFFTIEAEDGAALWASMIKPPDFDPALRYPVLVYIYGGPGSQMVSKRWGGNRYLLHQLLAQHGYIVFSIDNRGTGAQGRDWNRIVHRRLGEWELRDHIAGVRHLRNLPYVDGDRIGIYGGSYGGYMTLYALFRAPEHFRVGVSMYPVADWRLYDTIYTERYMDTPQDNPDGYRDSSCLNVAADLDGRLLLIHGTMDNNVHVQNSIRVIEELVEAGKEFELMLYPRERHGIRAVHRRLHLYRMMLAFILRNL